MSRDELRSDLAELNAEISTLQTQLARLRVDRKRVFDKLAAIVYPVLTLPDDVTAEIFLQYVRDYRYNRLKCGPMVLASVCKSWREVALSNPRLWSRFDTGLTPGVWDLKPTLLQMFISRSGQLPLTLRITLGFLSPSELEVLDIVGKHISQCGSLDLEVSVRAPFPISTPAQLPLLTSLHFRGKNDVASITLPFLLDAPRLREVKLVRISSLDWRTYLPWSQLTTLRLLYQRSFTECLEMVYQTPNLELLEFCHYGESEPAESSQPRILARLHTLELSAKSSYGIIPHLTLPALRDLSMVQPRANCASILKDLMERSKCSPTTLLLSTDYDNPNDVGRTKSILALLPTVSKLTLGCDDLDDDSFEELLELLGSPICPALTSLTLRECPSELMLTPLVEMLQSLMNLDPPRLSSFKLAIDTNLEGEGVEREDEDAEEWDSIDQLHRLRLAGLEIDIPSKNNWLKNTLNSRVVDVPR
ncbi:hypothetical protein FB45DRAFT_1066392 [Roridomyces roridus]|uniref:F-box domain-containing protein n=1 Tax=Roridomyces roridus TaxID=1738132 RepID=A0AAD7B555_9AGAR|nr:hypothetical protein FB45DRAFT_1066392 [Roridomyces roridus]